MCSGTHIRCALLCSASPRLTYSWSSNLQVNGMQHDCHVVYKVCILIALSLFSIAQSVIAYTSTWSAVVSYPRLTLSNFLVLCPYTLAPVPLFVLDPYVCHISSSLLMVSCLLFQSLLSGNLTVITLFNMYYGIILEAPIWKMGLFFSARGMCLFLPSKLVLVECLYSSKIQ
jgi:hypothetical protein